MKKIAIVLVILISLGLFCYSLPVSWFCVESGMTKSNVYELCGPPTDTSLRDIKGEIWEIRGGLWCWNMYLIFDNDISSPPDIWVNIGPDQQDIRIHLITDGQWDVRI